MEPVSRPGGAQTSQAPNPPGLLPQGCCPVSFKGICGKKGPQALPGTRGAWADPGPWALSMEESPPLQRLGGVKEQPLGCRLLEAPAARTSLLLGSWVGDSSTHSNPQKDRPSSSKSQGAQLCFWGPPALASAWPLLQSTRGQHPPFLSTSHCGSSVQGRAQVSRGRSATGLAFTGSSWSVTVSNTCLQAKGLTVLG